MASDDGLAEFVEELRDRHAAGEFLGQEHWDLGELTIKDVQYRVGHWLGRIDAFRAMSPEERHVWRDERRYIAWALGELRRHLAEQAG